MTREVAAKMHGESQEVSIEFGNWNREYLVMIKMKFFFLFITSLLLGSFSEGICQDGDEWEWYGHNKFVEIGNKGLREVVATIMTLEKKGEYRKSDIKRLFYKERKAKLISVEGSEVYAISIDDFLVEFAFELNDGILLDIEISKSIKLEGEEVNRILPMGWIYSRGAVFSILVRNKIKARKGPILLENNSKLMPNILENTNSRCQRK